MRKLLLLFSAVILSLQSCNNRDDGSAATGGGSISKLQINTDAQADVRSGSSSIRFVVEAYSDSEYNTPATIFDSGTESRVETTDGSISMILEDNSYYLLLWADTDESYNVSDLKSVSVASGKQMGDAWHGQLAINDTSSGTYSTTLARAIAKVNLNETLTFYSPTLKVAYSAYSAFNVATGDVSGSERSLSVDYTYDAPVTAGSLNTSPLYLFIPTGEASVMDFTFTDASETFSLTNVPVQTNCITNLNGHFSSLFVSSMEIVKSNDWEYNPEVPIFVTFVDSVFESKVLGLLGKVDGDRVTLGNAKSFTSLDVSTSNITDMTGIEEFTNLSTLLCNNSSLDVDGGNTFTSLDISALNNLTAMRCSNNSKLVELILPDDPSKLQLIYLFRTGLTSFDLTPLTGLVTFYGYNMPFETFDFRQCKSLVTVELGSNTNLKSIYLNEGQAMSGTWKFTGSNDDCEIYVGAKGDETKYTVAEYKEINSNIKW